MMGCGKSTIGRRIARRLGWEFVDTDAMIEAEAGCTVADIFAALGEEEFRRRETRVIEGLADLPSRCMVSVGGGAVLSEQNRLNLARLGWTVYLKVDPEELARRVGQTASRPLLAGRADTAEWIRELLDRREPLYMAADIVVATDGLTVRQAMASVLSAVVDHEEKCAS
jgi:shikimate kinase